MRCCQVDIKMSNSSGVKHAALLLPVAMVTRRLWAPLALSFYIRGTLLQVRVLLLRSHLIIQAQSSCSQNSEFPFSAYKNSEFTRNAAPAGFGVSRGHHSNKQMSFFSFLNTFAKISSYKVSFFLINKSIFSKLTLTKYNLLHF